MLTSWRLVLKFVNYAGLWRIASPGMLLRVSLLRTDVSEELSASIIRVTRIDELGTSLAVTSNRRTLRRNTKMETLSCSETSVLTRATRCNIPEDVILQKIKSRNSVREDVLNTGHFRHKSSMHPLRFRSSAFCVVTPCCSELSPKYTTLQFWWL
jgi:hypothetical protein